MPVLFHMINHDQEHHAFGRTGSSLPGSDLLTLIAGTLLFLYFFSGMTTGSYELVFLMQSSQETTGQVWWAGGEEDFDETRSAEFQIIEGIETYRIELPVNPVQLQKLRIDPGKESGIQLRLYYILFKRWGFTPWDLPLQTLQSNDGVRIVSLTNQLIFRTTSTEPSLTMSTDNVVLKPDVRAMLLYLGLSVLVLFLAYTSPGIIQRLDTNPLSVATAIGFAIVFGLVLIQALKAPSNTSPDERDHFLAAEFFKTHTGTPGKREELGIHTYNPVWNYSRVYQLGKHYLLAGKTSNLFDELMPSVKSVRIFGASLLLVMMMLALSFPGQAPIWVPFLITPQTWYIFSYVNDDFFPLFLSLVLVVITERYYPDLFQPSKGMSLYLPGLLMGILLGSLAYAKTNYLVFVLFYVGYIFLCSLNIQNGLRKFRFTWRTLKIPLMILAVALTVFLLRHASAYWSGDPELSPESRQYYEQIEMNNARLMETARSGEARYGSYLSMMTYWIPMAYKSFNGVYGFMDIYAPERYYTLLMVIHALLLIAIFWYFITGYSLERLSEALLLAGTFAAMLFASTWLYSYQHDYQPQGRHLFPLIPVISVFVSRLNIPYRHFLIPLILLFALSFYSFVFVAVLRI
jgi:hypothetical protein